MQFLFQATISKKSVLLDHISQSFNILTSKYGEDLHYIIAGDSNDLNLKSILQLDPRMRQIVTSPTRLNPDAILDPIITTLGNYYQPPVCLPPLGADPGSGGRSSDHLIVVGRPVNTANSKSARIYRHVTVRPLPQSGWNKLTVWMESQDWKEIILESDIHKKADNLHTLLMNKINEIFPEKKCKFTDDDQPWFTPQLKKLHRKKKREYQKNRKSEKYKKLEELFNIKESKAKNMFKKSMIDSIKDYKNGNWYSKLKRISNYDQEKSKPV